MKTKFLLIVAIIIGTAMSGQAQVANQRNDRQRIKQGVRSGELTKRETRGLVRSKRELRKDVRVAKSDGTVTARERRLLRKERRANDRKIYRAKHNRRQR